MALKSDLSGLSCVAGGLALNPSFYHRNVCPGPKVPEGRGPSCSTRFITSIYLVVGWPSGYIWTSDKQQIIFFSVCLEYWIGHTLKKCFIVFRLNLARQ